ncbi:toxin-activating lysine-acyltransferase [Spiribacter halobius]|uniref:RTX toxin-activating lysine-acyltransferase n=1 Tax=Sediminicurvatus halobius TaxID=2182432 RepID=A0A2U2N2X7_9GAMM|nr:toxin-activating lysine-acyltransferase [Spiribacter halobius]PWG63407.1 toxin-activating lysine-acyltransferase [Spiribacter halobius]UEX78077.1 toxin-activating lysine-acyltransferase [Spiribacter halobius]
MEEESPAGRGDHSRSDPESTKEQARDAEASAEPPRVAAVLGEIGWLLSQSPTHRHALFLADLEWLVVPAVSHGQFRVYRSGGQPVGAALWAFVSKNVGRRLEGGGRIAAGEWRSGERPWLVELIAPFGQAETMLGELRSTVLAGRRLSFSRLRGDGRRETVTLDPESAASSDTPAVQEAHQKAGS